MKIFLDTNILLDVYLKREQHFEKSYVAYLESINGNNECMVSAKSILDMNYVMKKTINKKDVYDSIEKTMNLATIIELTGRDLKTALLSNGKDFEDDVLTASAKSAKADCIITRNKNDFKQAGIKVMTPEEYLKSIKKDSWRVHETAAPYYNVEKPMV